MSAALRAPAEVVAAWNTERFSAALKQWLETLPAGTLPLGLAGPNGGAVDDSEVVVSVRDWRRAGEEIRIEVGVFYQEVVAGCSCGDDPMSLVACATLQVMLDPVTGVARLLPLAND